LQQGAVSQPRRFSRRSSARMTASVKAAIASIDDDAWTAIEYPQAI
jgi:hypothetical protein